MKKIKVLTKIPMYNIHFTCPNALIEIYFKKCTYTKINTFPKMFQNTKIFVNFCK